MLIYISCITEQTGKQFSIRRKTDKISTNSFCGIINSFNCGIDLLWANGRKKDRKYIKHKEELRRETTNKTSNKRKRSEVKNQMTG